MIVAATNTTGSAQPSWAPKPEPQASEPHEGDGTLHDGVVQIGNAHLLEAAERLSKALYHVVHQPTTKGRDRSLAALVALIYGPTPFGGVNNLKDVAMRYGMTEQNLFQLMRKHRELLSGALDPEYEI